MYLIAAAAGLAIAVALQYPVPLFFVAPLLPVAAMAAAAHLRTRRFLPLASLALAVTPFPVFVPRLLPFGARSLFVTDLVLPAVALVALRAPQKVPGADRAMGVYAFAMALLTAWGVSAGAELETLVQDLRGPVYIVCGYLIATRLLDIGDRPAIVRTVGAVLWWSAGMITLSLITGQELLSGRVGEARAFVGEDTKEGLEAVRFLIASKELALVALVAGLGGLLLASRRLVGWRVGMGVLFPAAFVLFMSFSRQSVVGLVAGVVVVLVASPFHIVSVRRLVAGGAALVVFAMLLGLSGLGARVTDPDSGILGQQVEGFTERVVGGLFGENLLDDPGNRFRALENEAAIEYSLEHPFIGGGMGAAYRGQLPLEAFDDVDYGIRYVHNVYLWYAVKGGLLGLAAVAVLLFRPFVRSLIPAMRHDMPHRHAIISLGAALAAIVVIGTVEPVIHLSTTAPLLGALVGALAVLARPVPVAGDRRATPALAVSAGATPAPR